MNHGLSRMGCLGAVLSYEPLVKAIRSRRGRAVVVDDADRENEAGDSSASARLVGSRPCAVGSCTAMQVLCPARSRSTQSTMARSGSSSSATSLLTMPGSAVASVVIAV